MAQEQIPDAAQVSIANLSPEILDLVFKYFCSHCCGKYERPLEAGPATQTLHNICLVSRYFRHIGQKALHHSFDLGYDTSLRHDSWGRRRLEPFLRTIALRPDLARSVKAAFLPWAIVEELSFHESRDVFDKCAQSLGTNAYEIYQRRRHSHQVSDYSPTIERAFFLGEPISDETPKRDYIPIVAGELLTIMVSLLPGLTHLGVVEDVYPHNKFEFDITPTRDALGVTTLPLKIFESDRGLTKLLSWTTGLEVLFTSGRGEFPNMPSLKALHFRTLGQIDPSAIDACLSKCTGQLSAFSYTAADPDISSIIQCIDQPKFHTSLEFIRLDLRCRPIRSISIKRICSLKLFTKLKVLFIPVRPIYDPVCMSPLSLIDILPPNIVSLILMEHKMPTPPGVLYQDLLHLAKAKPTLFKQLREIRSDSIQVFDQTLVGMFEEADVALIHQELPRSSWSCTGEISDDEYSNWTPWSPNGSEWHSQAMPLPGELSDDDL